jgi:hypothetical protein
MLRNRFVCGLIGAIVCIAAVNWCVSLSLQAGWLRRRLQSQLSATFGRPVEVGRFAFAILDGPELQADSITVGEDPRFGQEYFVRADKLTASLRWWPLLRGRMEFSGLSFERPSLNLVRSPEGKWNIETWLPSSDPLRSPQYERASATPARRMEQVDIDGGRINFKTGADKLPFALLDVGGYLKLQTGGRWFLDLTAQPMRAAPLQQSGTLHLRGTVGSASARLQPAELTLTWGGASLADAARLGAGTDYGFRGLFDAEIAARIDPGDNESASAWKIEGALRFRNVHRWNLAGRADNPGVNLKFKAAWRPLDRRVQVSEWLLEAPRSNVAGEAAFDWEHGFNPEITLLHSQIGYSDLVSWTHAFSPSVANDLEIAGILALDGRFSGWPLRVQDVLIKSSGVTIRTGKNDGSLGPVVFGPIQGSWSRSSVVLTPVTVRLLRLEPDRHVRGAALQSSGEGVLRVGGILGPIRPGETVREWPYALTIAGQTAHLQNLRALLASVGWQYGANWNVQGPASLQLIAKGALGSGPPLVQGIVDFHNLVLSNKTISEPIHVASGAFVLSPRGKRVEIAGAEAGGAEWKGSFEKKQADAAWTFDLSADELRRADIARDFAQSRRGFLYRLLPFAASPALSAEAQAAIGGINANGKLYVREIDIGVLHLERFAATAELRNGALTLRQAVADLSGGRITGQLNVRVANELEYQFHGQVDRTALSALGAWTSPKLRLGGIASGEVEFAAKGLTPDELAASLAGEGFLHFQDIRIDTSDLHLNLGPPNLELPQNALFSTSTVSFRVENGHIHVDPLLLADQDSHFEVTGDIGFDRRLNLQVRTTVNEFSGPDFQSGSLSSWTVTGTLDSPQVVSDTKSSPSDEVFARKSRR